MSLKKCIEISRKTIPLNCMHRVLHFNLFFFLISTSPTKFYEVTTLSYLQFNIDTYIYLYIYTLVRPSKGNIFWKVLQLKKKLLKKLIFHSVYILYPKHENQLKIDYKLRSE